MFFVPQMPRLGYSILGAIPEFHRIWRMVLRLLGGVKPLKMFDFVTPCPARTLKNLHRCLPANPQMQEFVEGFDESESVILNGEGTFISSTKVRREALVYLMYIQWAKARGKKVYVVNAMLSLDPISPENPVSQSWMTKFCQALNSVDLIYFRDRESLRLYRRVYPKASNAKFVPDALFAWPCRFGFEEVAVKQAYLSTIPFNEELDKAFQVYLESDKYIVVSGNSQAAWDQYQAEESYSMVVRELLRSFPDYDILLLESCDGDRFLRGVARKFSLHCVSVRAPIQAVLGLLGGASVFVSGRYHPSIMASLSGTPCVWMGSNSHKCFTLQEVLGYPDAVEFAAIPDEAEVHDLLAHLKRVLSSSRGIRQQVTEKVSELRGLVCSAYDKI